MSNTMLYVTYKITNLTELNRLCNSKDHVSKVRQIKVVEQKNEQSTQERDICIFDTIKYILAL